jgi:phospholipase/carboxylesterase
MRLYVLGFSQGVSMAYRFWVHRAAPLRGVIACSSDLPPDVTVRLDAAPPAKILLFHGSDDRIVPIAKSREATAILQAHAHIADLVEFDGGHYVPSLAVERVEQMIRHDWPNQKTS